MRKRKGNQSKQETWQEFDRAFQAAVPQLSAVLGDEGEFISILVKHQDDGTFLTVLKRYGPDGGGLVCFGGGYGMVGALMAIESTIASGNWRKDKPWQGRKG